MRVSVAVAIACFSIAGLSAADNVGAAIRKNTNIPGQGLGPALQTLAKEHGFQIVYVSDEVNSHRTQGATGALTAEEALTRLLNDTGLTYRAFGDNAVGIVPIAAATAGSLRNGGEKGPQTDEASSRSVQGRGTEEGRSGEEQEDGKTFWTRFRLAQLDQGQAANDRLAERSDTVSERKSARIEEVIVTAQRRAERLQDVPISMAVVTADDINRRGLVSAEDYLRGIPGVNQVDWSYGQSVVIRGIETSPAFQNFWSGTTVATYFGETPTTNSAGLSGGTNVDLKLVDIERVEVLRGPQGTAFGSSAMGGAVRTIPVTPKLDQFEGKVAVGYSVTSDAGGDNYNGHAVGNLPLIKDKLAIRATAYLYEDSGFYRNVAGSDEAFQTAVVTPFGAEAFAVDKEEVGSYYVLGGRIAALFHASDDLRFTLSYASQKTETDGFGVGTAGTYDQTVLQVAPEHVIRGQKEGLFDTDIDLVNAIIEFNLGWANLLATYSHINSGSMLSAPWTSSNANWPVSNTVPSDHREHVGEIRLTTQLDGAWNFLAGLYAEELKDETEYDYLWYGEPAMNLFAPGERSLGGYLDRRNLKQKAAFGEASWEFVQGLTLTGGVRAYEYDRTFGVDASGPFYGDLHVREDAEASGANFRANLSYKLLDGGLLYAGWSQGFRLGRPQQGLPPGLCDLNGDGIVDGTNTTIEATKRTNSDEVDSYEIGGKFALLDRRVTIDAALFRMEWSGMPVTVTAGSLSEGCGLGYLANAGEALSEGFEFQANFQVTEPFSIDLGGSWIHARLTEDVPALNASEGNRLPGSPEVNANLGLQYEFEIGGYKAFVRADSIYVGSFYGDLPESANTKAGEYVKLDTSARVEIGNLNIDLFVRNLTNEDAFIFRGAFPAGEFFGYRVRPRTIGFRLGYAF